MNQIARRYIFLSSLSLLLGFQNCSKVNFLKSSDNSPGSPEHASAIHTQEGNGPISIGGLDPTCLVSKGCDPIAKLVTENCKDIKYIDWPTTKIDVYPRMTTDFSVSSGGEDIGRFESIDNIKSISVGDGILQARQIKTITSISGPTDINATTIGNMSVSAHICLHNLENLGSIEASAPVFILGAGKLTISSLDIISSELLLSDASVDKINAVSAPMFLRNVSVNSLTNCSASIIIENVTVKSMDASCTAKLTPLP